MATPRKRYAVIETRLIREDWPLPVKWFAVALACHMVDRWAADGITFDQASTISLCDGDLCMISCKTDARSARKACKVFAGFAHVFLKEDAKRIVINWPKWAEIQGAGRPALAGRSPDVRPSASASSPKNSEGARRPGPQAKGVDRPPSERTPPRSTHSEVAARVESASDALGGAPPPPAAPPTTAAECGNGSEAVEESGARFQRERGARTPPPPRADHWQPDGSDHSELANAQRRLNAKREARRATSH